MDKHMRKRELPLNNTSEAPIESINHSSSKKQKVYKLPEKPVIPQYDQDNEENFWIFNNRILRCVLCGVSKAEHNDFCPSCNKKREHYSNKNENRREKKIFHELLFIQFNKNNK